MSEGGEQKNEHSGLSLVSPDTLYDTMSREADGVYKQLMTISTSFFGGSLLGCGFCLIMRGSEMRNISSGSFLWLG